MEDMNSFGGSTLPYTFNSERSLRKLTKKYLTKDELNLEDIMDNSSANVNNIDEILFKHKVADKRY